MSKGSQLGSPRTLLALIIGVAIVVAALLAVLSQLGGSGGGSAREVGKLYSGIPQNGTTLGKSSAPVTIHLYEDFQCPYCARFSREMLPDLVDDYVRDGQARLVSEPMAFLGPDSVRTARAALAAAEQDRYWPYQSLLFEDQGAENSGYATDEFLRGLAEKTPALDVGEWDADRGSASVEARLAEVQDDARAAGVDSTPTLVFSGPGGKVTVDELRDYGQISRAMDRAGGH